MIRGTKYWDDPKKSYIQGVGAFEESLSKFTGKKQLEICGMVACVNALALTGHNIDIKCGNIKLLPEDVMALWINAPYNYPALKLARKNIDPKDYMCNRIPQYFSVAIKAIFNSEAIFSWGCEFADIKKCVGVGQAVIVMLKDPAHYIVFKAYDDKTDELIYDDSWEKNYWPARLKGTSHFDRRLKESDFYNIDNFKIVVYP